MKKKQLKQVQNQAQDGRSMVEMLGVLAIIGVLSIGGISGYKMAMNRYQANQIANEINLMRTDAKIKVARGVGELLLGEPYDGEEGHLKFNESYGVKVESKDIFDEETNTTETGYSFTLSNIPAGVCKPLATLLDGMDDTADITIGGKSYYDEQDNFCGETNEVMVAFLTKNIGGVSSGSGEEPEVTDPDQGDEPQDNDPVCDETTCLGGTCNEEGVCKCNDPTEYWTGYGCTACPDGALHDGKCECPEGSHLRGSACIMCPEEAPWSDAADDCVCKEAGKSWTSDGKCIDNVCNSGQPCPDDEDGNPQYCYVTGISCNNGVPSASGGECRSIDDGDSINGYKAVEVENDKGGKKTIYKSNKVMPWLTADGFCRALGRKLGKPMHLVSLEGDLGCTTSTCPDGSYGKSLASKGLGSGFGGTSTLWPSNSCYAYIVPLDDDGYVGILNRNTYVLCE